MTCSEGPGLKTASSNHQETSYTHANSATVARHIQSWASSRRSHHKDFNAPITVSAIIWPTRDKSATNTITNSYNATYCYK